MGQNGHFIYIYTYYTYIYIHVWLFIIIYTVVPVCFTSKLATCEPFSWVLCAAAIFIVMTWTMKKFPQIEAQGPEHPRETGIQTKLQKLNKRKLRKPYLHLFHSLIFVSYRYRQESPALNSAELVARNISFHLGRSTPYLCRMVVSASPATVKAKGLWYQVDTHLQLLWIVTQPMTKKWIIIIIIIICIYILFITIIIILDWKQHISEATHQLIILISWSTGWVQVGFFRPSGCNCQ